MDLCFNVTSCKSSRIYRNKGHQAGKPYDKDDSDYLAFKETTWSYSKFVYRSTFLCEPVPPGSQPICCTTMTNVQMKLWYVHLYQCVLVQ